MSQLHQWMNVSNKIKEIIVYKSLSTDIFANLALEDWLLHNVNYVGRRILLLWRNTPTVVIGRYQNPWMEADFKALKSTLMARRRSGGGAVYHDLGNLNCSFFMHRSDYNRVRNLQLVCDAINANWKNLNLYVGERNDILCQGKKVSGSAARVGKDHTYHHFTLLIDTDSKKLHSLLKPNDKLIFSSSNATVSVPSSTVNLSPLTNGDLTYESACQTIAHQFYTVHNVQPKHHQIVDIDPSGTTDTTSDGVGTSLSQRLSDLVQELSSDQWIWNKTPPFNVQIGKEQFHVKNGLITNATIETKLIGLHFKDYLQQYI